MPADRSRASRQGSAAALDTSSTSLIPPMTSGGIAFAPNVTPGTFNDPPPPLDDSDFPSESLLFPPQSDDALPPRKSVHGRKKPENHIPRPPNAFILFRSAFIRSQHVSTGVETNHSTLSKIIGLTWQNLPNEERQIWHRKAKLAEEQHRIKFPQYAFKPLHSKTKGGKRRVREVGPKDQKRCAKIAELLVQGKKGQELDDAIKEFDKTHVPQVVMRDTAILVTQTANLQFTFVASFDTCRFLFLTLPIATFTPTIGSFAGHRTKPFVFLCSFLRSSLLPDERRATIRQC
ncbi:hypothetical protein H1R20_g8639, partial [Candolleomyces eurysporus]